MGTQETQGNSWELMGNQGTQGNSLELIEIHGNQRNSRELKKTHGNMGTHGNPWEQKEQNNPQKGEKSKTIILNLSYGTWFPI